MRLLLGRHLSARTNRPSDVEMAVIVMLHSFYGAWAFSHLFQSPQYGLLILANLSQFIENDEKGDH